MGIQSWALTTEARCVARNKKAHTSWNMGAILEGDRRSFARRGPRESLAEGMILRAREGNYDWIYGILRDGLASADVADARGYTVLAAAAVSPHEGCPRDCGPVAIWGPFPSAGLLSFQPISGMYRVRGEKAGDLVSAGLTHLLSS